MSSGACRALVAVLLALVASTVIALPVVAKNESLFESSIVTYTVDPSRGDIDVDIVIRLKNNNNRAVALSEWGPILVEDLTQPPKPTVSTGFSVVRSESRPGPWRAIWVKPPKIPAGETEKFRVEYTINASVDQSASKKESTPARVDSSYIYVCVPGQDTDLGSIELKIKNNARFKTTQSGSELVPSSRGLANKLQNRPSELFTCIEGTDVRKLKKERFFGPAERPITLQAWLTASEWLFPAESNSEPTLDRIHGFLGHDIPGEGPVVIRQTPPRTIGGYASAHDTEFIVQLDESAGQVIAPVHELSHAWFSKESFIELWLREGLASWTASAIDGSVCAPVEANTAGLALADADWQVQRPNADPDTINQTIADQDAAACGIVSAMASRMSDEQWRVVLGSMFDGETKYVGSGEPGSAATTSVNYREWLDAVDERGLVPAAKADPAYAANLDDLDFAQNLLEDFEIPVDPVELGLRSEARADYHKFLLDVAPLSAPLVVRKAMDDWEFQRAMAALDKSREVLDAVREVDEELPTGSLVDLVKPAFESARDQSALDDVLTEALKLREAAIEVFEPLSELQTASPEGWKLPLAITQAIDEQRFDDALAAISPALQVVEGLIAADAALPTTAGLLDQFRVIYERTATADKLEELADDVAAIRSEAEQTGIALDFLEKEVGEWQIPAAVTDPIDRGQITAGLAIVKDARAVVKAAHDATIALPEADLGSEIRPKFEAVTTGPQMADLRTEAEVKRDEAESVGGALKSLGARVPTWETPAVVKDPIEARDFASAATAAAAAQKWVENAWQADQDLKEMKALDRIKDDFESAVNLEQLEAGAALAEQWAQAADAVAAAIARNDQPRDLMEKLGLWGIDVQPTLDAALEAAIAGEVGDAFANSAEVIEILNGASSGGSLRLAGVVFVGIAILGVLGLWLMLRREAGPPWARQTKPHWVDDKKGSRWGRNGKDKKNKKKG